MIFHRLQSIEAVLTSVIITAGTRPESKKPIEEAVRVVGSRITGFLFESANIPWAGSIEQAGQGLGV